MKRNPGDARARIQIDGLRVMARQWFHVKHFDVGGKPSRRQGLWLAIQTPSGASSRCVRPTVDQQKKRPRDTTRLGVWAPGFRPALLGPR